MNWLDDMEAADPAYPAPGADPWAMPGYVPGTSRGLPAEADDAIGLYELHARLDDGHLEAARQLIADARADAEPGPEAEAEAS
jgi:hypothetical protein